MFVLRIMKVSGPYTVMLEGELVEQPAQPYAPGLPGWEEAWTAVLELSFSSMNKRYDLVQQHDLETLWVEYLTRAFPAKPRMAKPDNWAAALEYLTAKMHRRSVTYEEIAVRYHITVSAVRTCVKHIDDACGLRQKMKAIYAGARPDGSCSGAAATTEDQ
ncbi:hypothetical protein D3C76_1122620 [compost metagenome]